MSEKSVKNAVYYFVNEASEKLDLWISSIYTVNHFILLDSETETPNYWTLDSLEEELKRKNINLRLDENIKKEAIQKNYEYEDFFV